MMKKIWFLSLFLLWLVFNVLNISFAEPTGTTTWPIIEGTGTKTQLNCNDLFILTGPTAWLLGYTTNYELLRTREDFSQISKTNFKIDWKTVENTGFTLQHTFTTTGSHTVWVQLTTPLCTWSSETQVSIFEKQILYIGNDTDFLNFWFEEELNKAGYLLTKKPYQKIWFYWDTRPLSTRICWNNHYSWKEFSIISWKIYRYQKAQSNSSF